MTSLLIGLALLAGVAALALLVFRNRAPAPVAVRPPARSVRPIERGARPAAAIAATAGNGIATAPAETAVPAALPEALAAFQWLSAETLAPERRTALVAAIRRIPRPPAALHQLLSPQFLERASSTELSELITGEAQIAAKVLANVNSPFYGLRQPVTSIGQSVTFLGLNSVRSICLQYLLDESFKPRNAELKHAYEQTWAASSLASELCARLTQRLSLADNGALVAQVLLSFIGHLASATLMLQQAGNRLPEPDLLSRLRWAQDGLGLGAAEIGGLLLQAWALPPAIVDEVRDIDRMLVTPVGAIAPQRAQRLALAYLCARLGERLARSDADPAAELATFDLANEPGADFFHLRGHLAALPRLSEHLHAADLGRSLQALRAGARTSP
jgi:HD-like signal output (HDOD) protein